MTDAEATIAELTAKLKEERETRIAEKVRERPEPRIQRKIEINNEEYNRVVKELSDKNKLIEQLVSERQAALQHQDPEDFIPFNKSVSRPTTSGSPNKAPRRSVYVSNLEKENADLKLQLSNLQESLSIAPNNSLPTTVVDDSGVAAAVAAEPNHSNASSLPRKVNFRESPESLFASSSIRYPYYEGRSTNTLSTPSTVTATPRRELHSRASPSRLSRPSTTRTNESGMSVTNSMTVKPGTASSSRTLVNTPSHRSPSRK